MKKLTAGIFAGILTVVAAGAANAEITNRSLTTVGYVKNITDALDDDITAAEDAAAVLEGRVDTAETGIGNLETTVGDATSGLVKSVAENTDAIDEIKDSENGILAAAKTYADDAAALEDTVTENGTKGVKSSGIYTAIEAAKTDAINTAATDATTKADQALEDAQDYADGLAGNYAAKSVQTAVENTTTGLAATKAIADGAVLVNTTQTEDIATNTDNIATNVTNIATNTADIDKIENGTTTVGKATQATQDANGNVINTTYETKTNAADTYIPKPGTACAESTNGCVLKSNGTTLKWEPIADTADVADAAE